MTDTRNPDSDLVALAVMPGLEELAEVLAPYARRTDPVSLLVFSGLAGAIEGRNKATSFLKEPGHWDRARDAAARVGRTLSTRPPTHDQLWALRERGHADLGLELAAAFMPAMRPLVHELGVLLPGSGSGDLLLPNRANVVYGDGTTFSPLSEVKPHRDGGFEGSFSTGVLGPRIAKVSRGKDEEGKRKYGVQFSMIGAHAGVKHQRVVLGLEAHDGNEIAASMRLIADAVGVYRGGVHGVVYDMLMSGPFVRRALRLGVMPIAEMPNARDEEPSIVVSRAASPGGSHKNVRVKAQLLETVDDRDGNCDCVRDVWAIDGALRSCPIGYPPTAATDRLEQLDLRFVGGRHGDHRLLGLFRVRCPHGGLRFEIDFAGDRPGTGKQGSLSVADHVRPINRDTTWTAMRGYRSDVESLFSTIKNLLPKTGRASSLDVGDFAADLVGVALLLNARAYDTHVAVASRYAKRAAARRRL